MKTNVTTELKDLAFELGLRYCEEDMAEEILLAISEELEAQIDEAEDNPHELSTLMGYMNRLHSLDDRLNELNEVKETIDFVRAKGANRLMSA